MVLRPPVEPMLAQAAESVPGPGVLKGGAAYEQKFDGHRALLFTPASPGGPVLLQSRRGSLIQDRFPDLVAAAEQLPDGLVLDGELLVWDTEEGRLSFEALQRRAAARGRSAPTLAARTPAYYVAFDVLQLDGTELLTHPYAERRAQLENLFTHNALSAPWTLCPMTTDRAKAQEWLESWTDVSGVEGIVVKAMNQRYLPSARGWYKIRRRDTIEALIGAITGTLTRPQLLVLRRHDHHGRLRAVGRTVRCAQTKRGRSPSTWPRPAPVTPGKAFVLPRRGGPATSWTRPSCARNWWRRWAPTVPSTAAASTATRCGSRGCAWT
ncbi:ATP-dependent DNA ligase [Streptomyces sp. NPDC002073]